MTTTICQAAIALAGISITLQVAAALARSSSPELITPTEEKSPHHASLRLTHRELRALSTHHDRRARQLNNQLSPDAGLQQVNVNLVKDFLSQGDTQGKLGAQQWNETIDVTPA